MSTKECVFCKIAKGQDEKTNLLYQDEKVVVFRDIRPAAEHHYLICPREHIPNAKSLTSLHIPFVENMVEIGKQVLQEQKADISKARFGFHWPPFCMISHLHLHAISPADGIRTIYWLTGAFSPGMPWFKSADWVIDWLKTSGTASEASVSAETVVPTGASARAVEGSESKNETKPAETAAAAPATSS
jgi:diadenosine tetraphosphate (Ap4A) HIT family hydrolase